MTDTKLVFSPEPNILLPHLHTSSRCENFFPNLRPYETRFADKGNLQIDKINKDGRRRFGTIETDINDELKINRNNKFGIVKCAALRLDLRRLYASFKICYKNNQI